MKAALLARRTVLAASIDTDSYVESALEQIVSKGSHSRSEAYELLTLHFEDAQRHYSKKCLPVIEKIPTLLETIRRDDYEPFVRFISVLADNISADIQNSWNKNMNKIITTIIRMLNGRGGKALSLFLASVLHQFAVSRVRSNLIPFTKQIKDIGYQLLSYQHNLLHHQRESLTDLLAFIISLEPVTQWNISLNDILLEMTALLMKLTLFPTRSSSTQEKPQVTLFTVDKLLNPTVTGVNKTQLLEGLFAQLCCVYSKALQHGYATNFASLDLTGLVVLERAVLTVFADVNTNDPAAFIENEDRISKVDVALVSSRLKISMVKMVRNVLALNLPGLVRYGSLFLHPLCVLLGRREVHTVPLLLHELLLTFQVSARVLANSTWMMLQNTGSVQVLLQLVQVQCELISGERKHHSALDMMSTSSSSSVHSSKSKKDLQALQMEQDGNLVFHATALVLAASSIAQQQQQQQQQQSGVLGKRKHYLDQDVEPANDTLVITVLATLDALLLHAGRLLTAQPEGKHFLEQIQIALLFPLIVLQRGVLPSHFQDKKMHRLFAERIRHSMALQTAVLRSAGNVFLVTGAAEHIFLPIVRDVAQNVLRQIGSGAEAQLCTEAQRILFVTGHLVHPSVLPMPAPTPNILAADYLAKEKKRRRQEDEQRDIDLANVSTTATTAGATSASGASAATINTTNTSSLFTNPLPTATQESHNISNTTNTQLSYAASAPALEVSKPKDSSASAVSANLAKSSVKKVIAPVMQIDDGDDDIPDIDISSDQE